MRLFIAVWEGQMGPTIVVEREAGISAHFNSIVEDSTGKKIKIFIYDIDQRVREA